MAVDKVAHVQGPRLTQGDVGGRVGSDGRRVRSDVAMTGGADAGGTGDRLLLAEDGDVPVVDEVDVVRQAVHALPGDGLTAAPGGAELLNLSGLEGVARRHDLVAEHALFDGGHGGCRAPGHAPGAEGGVYLVDGDVRQVGELDGLLWASWAGRAE